MAAVDQVWAHMAQGNIEKTLSGHLQPGDAELLGKLTKTLEVQAELLESGVVEIRAVYARIEGDWALVPIHFTMKRDGETRTSVAECWVYHQTDEEGEKQDAKQAKTWKIVSEAVMRDSKIKPLRNGDLKALQEWWHEHAKQLMQLKPQKEPVEK